MVKLSHFSYWVVKFGSVYLYNTYGIVVVNK